MKTLVIWVVALAVWFAVCVGYFRVDPAYNETCNRAGGVAAIATWDRQPGCWHRDRIEISATDSVVKEK